MAQPKFVQFQQYPREVVAPFPPTSLSYALENIPVVGPFAVGGVFDEWMDQKGADKVEDPQLHITGVGGIKMPLTAATAKKIRGVAHRAPFGKGRDTVVDLETRKTWELDPDQVKIGNNEFNTAATVLAQRTAFKLGVPESVKVGVSLYKVLLYEPGDFFLPHRDTEKVPGMFATFTVSMRSKKVGGSTVVHHRGVEQVFDESEEGGSDHYHYTMFFADCMHEVLKLEEGHRLVLVFNVYRKTKVGANAIGGPHGADADCLAKIKAGVQGELELDTGDGNWKPSKKAFLYFLEHPYTDISGSFSQLKGNDRTRFEYLKKLTVDIPFRMALASVRGKLLWEGFGPYNTDMEHYDTEIGYLFADFMDPSDATKGWISMELENQFYDHLRRKPKPTDVETEEYLGNSGPKEHQVYRLHVLVLYPIPLDSMKPLGTQPTSRSSSGKRQSNDHPSEAPEPKRKPSLPPKYAKRRDQGPELIMVRKKNPNFDW